MLDDLRDVLPIGMEEWVELTGRHAVAFPEANRTAEFLRRKFASLCRVSAPTGSTTCPPEVREAKRIKRMIIERSEPATGEDAAETTAGSFEDVPGIDNLDSNHETSDADALSNDASAARPATPGSLAHSKLSSLSAQPVERRHPRPLVAVRSSRNNDDDIMQLLRIQLIQSQEEDRRRSEAEEAWRLRRERDRDDEHRRLEEERAEERERRVREQREREREPAEDCQWRQDMMMRHEQLMQTMLLLLGKRE